MGSKASVNLTEFRPEQKLGHGPLGNPVKDYLDFVELGKSAHCVWHQSLARTLD